MGGVKVTPRSGPEKRRGPLSALLGRGRKQLRHVVRTGRRPIPWAGARKGRGCGGSRHAGGVCTGPRAATVTAPAVRGPERGGVLPAVSSRGLQGTPVFSLPQLLDVAAALGSGPLPPASKGGGVLCRAGSVSTRRRVGKSPRGALKSGTPQPAWLSRERAGRRESRVNSGCRANGFLRSLLSYRVYLRFVLNMQQKAKPPRPVRGLFRSVPVTPRAQARVVWRLEGRAWWGSERARLLRADTEDPGCSAPTLVPRSGGLACRQPETKAKTIVKTRSLLPRGVFRVCVRASGQSRRECPSTPCPCRLPGALRDPQFPIP